MQKRFITLLVLSSIALTTSIGWAQEKRENKADHKFEKYEYINAIEIYEKAVEKGFKSVNALQKLGDAYYFNGKLTEANKWYDELIQFAKEKQESLGSEYYYRYAQTLRAMQQYEQADAYMSTFTSMEEQDSRAQLFEANKNKYRAEIEKRSNRYEIEPLPMNSPYSDYGATIYKGQLIYTSARASETVSGSKVHKWTNEAYTSLYASTINSDGTFEEPQLFFKDERSDINQSTAVFTKDGKTVYFTQNAGAIKDEVQQNKYKNALLQLFQATLLEDGTWSKPVALTINDPKANNAHPALTPDNKWLYFVSDRSESIGQSDLFRVEIKEDGSFAKVESVGKQINTEGRETFPFISSDYMLYFATDGRPGLGGLDIFMAKINVDGSFGTVTNIGEPMNSPADDFSYYFDPKAKKGFVSSNRTGGAGGDDLYLVQEKKEIDCKQSIDGFVFHAATREALAGATITLYDATYTALTQVQADEQGKFSLADLDCGKKYRLKAEATGFQTKEIAQTMGYELQAVEQVEIGLEPVQETITESDDLFKKLRLEPIYFDFDKATIRPDAAAELAKVVEVLNMYPNITIDVRSHTDSRGNDAYNMQLSERRAKSTMQWMIKQGIDPSRISGRGYGESQLINECQNGVPCSKEQHQENRRSEFIILKM
ncbi:OmpA family protein [Myroides sp. C15-4]|uniref:OmpA family protein n=1 Tax=Myroides sp. C15-4 TaxID=3400532 RepID=UPI003D2F7A72